MGSCKLFFFYVSSPYGSNNSFSLFLGPVGRPGKMGPKGPKGEHRDHYFNTTGSTTFVRWGKTICPNNEDTKLIYSGKFDMFLTTNDELFIQVKGWMILLWVLLNIHSNYKKERKSQWVLWAPLLHWTREDWTTTINLWWLMLLSFMIK